MDLEKNSFFFFNLLSKILNFIIDLQQYNPYDALMVKNYNKKSLFLSFQDFQDFSGTGAGIPDTDYVWFLSRRKILLK